MQDETKSWLAYSEENLEASKVLILSELYNPCLHNIQQFFYSDKNICKNSIVLAERVIKEVKSLIK